MWISKIELTKFKSYQHAELVFPEPTEEQNIVLIGGMNGYGKTTILEALYLCLYGSDAMAHLARAGLKTDEYRGYPTFLEKALNGEARRDGADLMSVRVVIHRTKTKAVDILRRWYFKGSTGAWLEEEAVVREVVRDIPGTPKTDGKGGFQLSQLLEEQFVPAHIAPFFFFDGEEVKKLADQSRVEQVKQGLEGLLGIVLLRNLADRLKEFESSRRSKISSTDEVNIERLLEALTVDEKQLGELQKTAGDGREQLSKLKADRDAAIERITSLGGGGGDIASVKELVEEREQFRNAKRELQKSLESILADKLPFYLMTNSLIEQFRVQLEREIALSRHQAETRSLEPRRAQFEQSFLDEAIRPEIEPKLTVEQLSAIRSRIKLAWASLFSPPPANCAERYIHSYLHDGLRERTLQFLNSMSVGQTEVYDLLASGREIDDRLEKLVRKISQLEGVSHDGTLQILQNTYSTVTGKIEAVDEQVRTAEREIVGLEKAVNDTRSRYTQELKRRDVTNPVRELLNRSERVRAVIDEVVPLLFPLKVRALGIAMTKVYKQLAHKDQVAEIVIGNDGTTKILGKTGKSMPFDRSAGENQIFATALIAGLAEVSGVKAPMVVDTPLGRLDSKHRQNIFQFWTNSNGRQVILLSQDEEIDNDFFKKIKANVCATYLLEHRDVGDGIGRTTVKAGKYFGVTK